MDEKEKSKRDEKPRLGVSGFLPRPAAERLAKAAELARDEPFNDFKRRLLIDDAIRYVKLHWPEFFHG